MIHATELLGAETYDSLGNFVGRVKEMQSIVCRSNAR